MKKIFISLLLFALLLPVFGQNQDEFKFSLVPRRVAVPSLTGYLKADGTVPLTADWANPAYSISALNLTATPTLGAELITFDGSLGSGTGWSFVTGGWVHASGTVDFTTTFTPTANQLYKLTWTGTGSAGSAFIKLGTSSSEAIGVTAYTGGTYYFTPATTDALRITPSNTYNGKILSISLKAVTSSTGEVAATNMRVGNQLLSGAGTAHRPSISFAESPETGIFTYHGYLEVAVEGNNRVTFQNQSTYFNQDFLGLGGYDSGTWLFMSNATAGVHTLQLSAVDVTGAFPTVPAIFNITNTWTSTTNYERGFLRATATAIEVGTEKGSAGGTARPLNFYTDGTLRGSLDIAGKFSITRATIGNAARFTNDSFNLGGDAPLEIYDGGRLISIGNTNNVVGVNYPVVMRADSDGFHIDTLTDLYLRTPNNVHVLGKAITQGAGTGLTVNSVGHLNQQVYVATVSYTGFSSAGSLTADHTIATLPAGTKIIRIWARTTTPYAGTGVTDVDLCVGKSAGGVEYITTHNVFSAAYNAGDLDADMGTEMTRAAMVQGGSIIDWVNPITVIARITTTTAHTDDLTAGVTKFYIETVRY
jgi:hypothetical protein